jgi:spermidine/putrescine-binding protein
MARSMAVRRLLAAALLLVLAGCGGTEPASRELRLVAPADLVEPVPSFERATGCRVEVRVYDEGEDLAAIVRRRDADVVASPTPPGELPDDSVELVHVTLDGGPELTVPKRLASAFDGPTRPAGRRSTTWVIRKEGENPDCARRWIAYATSQ